MPAFCWDVFLDVDSIFSFKWSLICLEHNSGSWGPSSETCRKCWMKSYRLWYFSGHIVIYTKYTVQDAYSSKRQWKDCEWTSQLIVYWQLGLFNRRCMEANELWCGIRRPQKRCYITAEPSCYFLVLLHKEWSVVVIFAKCMQSMLYRSQPKANAYEHTQEARGRASFSQAI